MDGNGATYFVDAGRKYIQNKKLFFQIDVKSYFAAQTPDMILLSSVLQYLKDPYSVLGLIAESGTSLILIDRMIMSVLDTNRVFLQKKLKAIYEVSYPVWSLSQQKIIAFMAQRSYVLWKMLSISEFSNLKNIDSDFMGLTFFYRTHKGL